MLYKKKFVLFLVPNYSKSDDSNRNSFNYYAKYGYSQKDVQNRAGGKQKVKFVYIPEILPHSFSLRKRERARERNFLWFSPLMFVIFNLTQVWPRWHPSLPSFWRPRTWRCNNNNNMVRAPVCTMSPRWRHSTKRRIRWLPTLPPLWSTPAVTRWAVGDTPSRTTCFVPSPSTVSRAGRGTQGAVNTSVAATPTQATQTLVRINSQENLIPHTLTLTIAPSLSVGLIATKLHACFNVCLHISSVSFVVL